MLRGQSYTGKGKGREVDGRKIKPGRNLDPDKGTEGELAANETADYSRSVEKMHTEKSEGEEPAVQRQNSSKRNWGWWNKMAARPLEQGSTEGGRRGQRKGPAGAHEGVS